MLLYYYLLSWLACRCSYSKLYCKSAFKLHILLRCAPKSWHVLSTSYALSFSPSSAQKASILTRVENPGTTFFCLRLVSPSRLAVFMWHTPLGSDVCRSRMSAGMIWLESTLTKSPTRTSFHLLSTKHICFLGEGEN